MVIKIRFTLIIILVPFIYPMRPCVICQGTCDTEKKDGVLLCNAEKNLPKVKPTAIQFISIHIWGGLISGGGKGLIIGDGLISGRACRAFSLMWRASMLIYWNKRKRLHKKRVQLPQDWFGTSRENTLLATGTGIFNPNAHRKYITKKRKSY